MLSGVRLEYTEEELALIADSQRPDEEGMRKWARVNDFSGRSYAMAGLNKEKDDFTVPAGFPLSRFWSSDFHPRWIRAPDSHDPPGALCDGWYVCESRKGYLVHRNGFPVRPYDTIGMYATPEHPGMMTLVFDSRTDEEISKEAYILGLKNPGMLADLKDDIPLGMSPKKNKKRRISGMSPKKNKKRRISETP